MRDSRTPHLIGTDAPRQAPNIEVQSGQKVKKNTLVSNLSRYVKYNDTFTRPAPSVFGLVKFNEKPADKAEAEHVA
jgi:hypothetical protein